MQVYDVTKAALLDMCQLGRLRGATAAEVGEYLVVHMLFNNDGSRRTHYVRASWAVDTAEDAIVHVAHLIDRPRVGDSYYKYEIWHVVAEDKPLQAAIDFGREACRDLTNDNQDYRSYVCRCFTLHGVIDARFWDDPDGVYVGELGLLDYDTCERFARRATASGILSQVEVWAEVRACTRSYESCEQVRVATFRDGVRVVM